MGSTTHGEPHKTDIRVRKTPTELDFFGRLYVDDYYPGHRLSRFNGGFRNADEVLKTIAALKTLLPVIDRLGSIE